MRNWYQSVRFTGLVLATLFAFVESATAQQVKGAGASFPAAVYRSWAFGFTKEK